MWPGQKILIIGAVGGVGMFAVQLAGLFGAQVTGVCGTAKTDLVRSVGARDIIDHIRDDFADRRRIAADPLHRRHLVRGRAGRFLGGDRLVPAPSPRIRLACRLGHLSLSVPGPTVGM